MDIPTGTAFTASECYKKVMITSTWAGKWTAFKVGISTLFNLLTGIKYLTLSQVLIAYFRLSLKDKDVPL
jgi:3-oxosteroid 1-dehydrogenase